MKKKNQDRSVAETPDRKEAGTPVPEQGSPHVDEEAVSDDVAEQVEKGKDKDANPLAPPINIQAGS